MDFVPSSERGRWNAAESISGLVNFHTKGLRAIRLVTIVAFNCIVAFFIAAFPLLYPTLLLCFYLVA